jgi:hypothetical protein
MDAKSAILKSVGHGIISEICNTIEINVQAFLGSTGAGYELFLSLD